MDRFLGLLLVLSIWMARKAEFGLQGLADARETWHAAGNHNLSFQPDILAYLPLDHLMAR